MKSVIHNNIIVIGADHHNTLAAIRCFGKLKCNMQVLVHTKQTDLKKVRISQSVYACDKTACVVEDPNGIVQWLLDNRGAEKQILFPCSDLAAHTIDTYYEALCEYYIIPGFKNAPGKVAELMDKWEQSKFAREYGLPMAKSWSLENANGFPVPEDVVYPCIIKPEISAFGNKSDIVVCNNRPGLDEALENLKTHGYEKLLLQQFLEKEYEICGYGCLTDNKASCAGGMIRKLREYPPNGGGSSTFAQFTQDTRGREIYERVLDVLYDMGYRGLYDMDILVCKDKAYLNEINFRHGGNGYGLVDNGVYAPYYWCADAVGISLPAGIKTAVKNGKCQMDDLVDFFHVKEKRISLLTWIGDLMRTNAFCKWNVRDLKGTFAYYRPLLKAVVGKRLGRKGRK